MIAAAVAAARPCARGARLLVRGRDGKMAHTRAVSVALTWPASNNSRSGGAAPAREASCPSPGAGLLALPTSTRCVAQAPALCFTWIVPPAFLCPLCHTVTLLGGRSLLLHTLSTSGEISAGTNPASSARLSRRAVFPAGSVYLLRRRSYRVLLYLERSLPGMDM